MFWIGFVAGAGLVTLVWCVIAYAVSKRIRFLISLMYGHIPKKKKKKL